MKLSSTNIIVDYFGFEFFAAKHNFSLRWMVMLVTHGKHIHEFSLQ